MTPRQFYDWQTSGGSSDVMLLVRSLEQTEVSWCAINDLAVNHWAAEPMVTKDVDIVITTNDIDRAVDLLEKAGFKSKRFPWSINLQGISTVSVQISTEALYRDFPGRSVPADVHGILMRVASLDDTLQGKIAAWHDDKRRQSKKLKDLGDIARLVESHPQLWERLDDDLKDIIKQPS
jgi:hypothetical protein